MCVMDNMHTAMERCWRNAAPPWGPTLSLGMHAQAAFCACTGSLLRTQGGMPCAKACHPTRTCRQAQHWLGCTSAYVHRRAALFHMPASRVHLAPPQARPQAGSHAPAHAPHTPSPAPRTPAYGLPTTCPCTTHRRPCPAHTCPCTARTRPCPRVPTHALPTTCPFTTRTRPSPAQTRPCPAHTRPCPAYTYLPMDRICCRLQPCVSLGLMPSAEQGGSSRTASKLSASKGPAPSPACPPLLSQLLLPPLPLLRPPELRSKASWSTPPLASLRGVRCVCCVPAKPLIGPALAATGLHA